MEPELVYRQMEYPKFFIIESDWKSPFYLNQDVIKLVDIMEVVIGIFNIKKAVLWRKPQEMTGFLDGLKEVLIQKSKNEGYFHP